MCRYAAIQLSGLTLSAVCQRKGDHPLQIYLKADKMGQIL